MGHYADEHEAAERAARRVSVLASEWARLRALEAEVAALRGALGALVAVSPVVRYGTADYDCHYCPSEGPGSWWATKPEEVEHAAGCVWVVARALLAGARADGEGR